MGDLDQTKPFRGNRIGPRDGPCRGGGAHVHAHAHVRHARVHAGHAHLLAGAGAGAGAGADAGCVVGVADVFVDVDVDVRAANVLAFFGRGLVRCGEAEDVRQLVLQLLRLVRKKNTITIDRHRKQKQEKVQDKQEEEEEHTREQTKIYGRTYQLEAVGTRDVRRHPPTAATTGGVVCAEQSCKSPKSCKHERDGTYSTNSRRCSSYVQTETEEAKELEGSTIET